MLHGVPFRNLTASARVTTYPPQAAACLRSSQLPSQGRSAAQIPILKCAVQAQTNVPGRGKGTVLNNRGDGVAAQQFQVRLGKNTTVPLTLGFTKSNELFVGRMAMLGFAAAVVGEIVSGQGYAAPAPACVQIRK
jgi:hypothetical protein